MRRWNELVGGEADVNLLWLRPRLIYRASAGYGGDQHDGNGSKLHPAWDSSCDRSEVCGNDGWPSMDRHRVVEFAPHVADRRKPAVRVFVETAAQHSHKARWRRRGQGAPVGLAFQDRGNAIGD